MLINARPRHTLCRLHKPKCLPARGGGLIKDILVSTTGMCEYSEEEARHRTNVSNVIRLSWLSRQFHVSMKACD